MKKIINYSMIFLCIGVLISCAKDFIVKDIKNDTVSIIAPYDNLITPNNLITFWWDELDGAETYNLQIVKPRFDSVIQLLVDTTIVGNKFDYIFTPGRYQWRIKANNAGGSTVFTTRTLKIDTTSNLNLVSVSLGTPAPNFVTGNNSVTFTWNALPSASNYELLITTSSAITTTISNGNNTSYTYSFSTVAGVEEKFTWRVKAYNSFSNTQINTTRSLRIDHKSPTVPSLLSPANNSLTVQDSMYLTWNRSSSDVYFDSLFVSTDSFISQSQGMEVYERLIRINAINPSLSVNNFYFWRVKSVDSVYNRSSFTPIRKFRLIP